MPLPSLPILPLTQLTQALNALVVPANNFCCEKSLQCPPQSLHPPFNLHQPPQMLCPSERSCPSDSAKACKIANRIWNKRVTRISLPCPRLLPSASDTITNSPAWICKSSAGLWDTFILSCMQVLDMFYKVIST